jgi:hypothetical protein
MEDKLILRGKMKSGKEEYGNHRGIHHHSSLDEMIARIKFRRTVRRLIKIIKG